MDTDKQYTDGVGQMDGCMDEYVYIYTFLANKEGIAYRQSVWGSAEKGQHEKKGDTHQIIHIYTYILRYIRSYIRITFPFFCCYIQIPVYFLVLFLFLLALYHSLNFAFDFISLADELQTNTRKHTNTYTWVIRSSSSSGDSTQQHFSIFTKLNNSYNCLDIFILYRHLK